MQTLEGDSPALVYDANSSSCFVALFHWGWVTPAVTAHNRSRQIGAYREFLEKNRGSGRHFTFTHPGWAFDDALEGETLRATSGHPDPNRRGVPFASDFVAYLRERVREGLLSYVAYPYSGAVVEGMHGESVLFALRLTRRLVQEKLGLSPRVFLAHDPQLVRWNAPMMIQIGRLAGYEALLADRTARVFSPDGTIMRMYGQPPGSLRRFDMVELMYAEEQLARQEAKGCLEGNSLRFVSIEEMACGLSEEEFPPLAADPAPTKGWYGGAPIVMRMQAALRRADLRLGVAASVGAFLGGGVPTLDLRKRSLILQDVHYQWILEDLATHRWPAALRLERETVELTERRLVPAPEGMDGLSSHYFNPLPFVRSSVVRRGKAYVAVSSVEAFASAVVEEATKGEAHAGAASLRNDQIDVRLGPSGEIVSVRAASGRLLYGWTANRVLRWRAVPAGGAFALENDREWADIFTGNIVLETDFNAPQEGDYAFAFEVVRGQTITCHAGDGWVPAVNRHWGGGLPSAAWDLPHSGTGTIRLRQGRNTIRLHAVADRGFAWRGASLAFEGKTFALAGWRGTRLDQWEEEPFVARRIEARNLGARAEVEFFGGFSTCEASLLLSLDYGSEIVESRLVRTCSAPVHEGFPTAPLPLEIGSHLGSYCERPYVPAFTVEHETAPGQTAYASDKPFGYAAAVEAFGPSRTGVYPFRRFFDGLSPFLGIDSALAESPSGSMLMVTDGHNHFFRRETSGGRERLGLSLGSSAIHPQTQGYRIPVDSPWGPWSRSYTAQGRAVLVDLPDAFEECGFVPQAGEETCSWALYFGREAAIDRRFAWNLRLSRLVPLVPAACAIQALFRLHGKGIVLSGADAAAGGIRMRLLNLEAGFSSFRVELSRAVGGVGMGNVPEDVDLRETGDGFSGVLPPFALREFDVRFL